MKGKRSAAAALRDANALAEAATRHARSVRETATELLQASTDAAVRPSDVLGGVIGGASAGAAAIYFIGVTTLSALAIPFIAVAGLGIGALIVRGPRAIAADRDRRTRAIVAASEVDRPRLLREEIEAAKLAGAPPEILEQLWRQYVDELAPASSRQSIPSVATPQLALPPGPPTDHETNPTPSLNERDSANRTSTDLN